MHIHIHIHIYTYARVYVVISVLFAKWKYCLSLAVLRMVCNSGEFLKILSTVWDSTPLFFYNDISVDEINNIDQATDGLVWVKTRTRLHSVCRLATYPAPSVKYFTYRWCHNEIFQYIKHKLPLMSFR